MERCGIAILLTNLISQNQPKVKNQLFPTTVIPKSFDSDGLFLVLTKNVFLLILCLRDQKQYKAKANVSHFLQNYHNLSPPLPPTTVPTTD